MMGLRIGLASNEGLGGVPCAHLVSPAIPWLGDTVTSPPAGHAAVTMPTLDCAVTTPRAHRRRTSTVNVYCELGSNTCAGTYVDNIPGLALDNTVDVTSTGAGLALTGKFASTISCPESSIQKAGGHLCNTL
jgi:hypothetical protein